MDQELSARAERVLERFSEDESLTGDLTDSAATALLDWITQQVQAADAVADDALFQAQVTAIRSAARAAAQAAAEDDSVPVVERAQAALTKPAPKAVADATPATPQPPAAAAPAPSTSSDQPSDQPSSATRPSEQPARRSVWNSLRRQVRRWVHRKV